MSRPLAFLLISLTLAVAPAAPRLKDRPISYFPTQLGACWVYDVDGMDETRTITHVRDEDGAKLLTVEWTWAGTDESTVETVGVSTKGLYRMGFDNEPFEQPWFMLRFPPSSGHTWKREPTKPFFGEETARVYGPEKVMVPAGIFTAYRVEFDCKADGGFPMLDTLWFAEIGMVKHKSWSGQTSALKSFTPGKTD
jgi:hypothetical protein